MAAAADVVASRVRFLVKRADTRRGNASGVVGDGGSASVASAGASVAALSSIMRKLVTGHGLGRKAASGDASGKVSGKVSGRLVGRLSVAAAVGPLLPPLCCGWV